MMMKKRIRKLTEDEQKKLEKEKKEEKLNGIE